MKSSKAASRRLIWKNLKRLGKEFKKRKGKKLLKKIKRVKKNNLIAK